MSLISMQDNANRCHILEVHAKLGVILRVTCNMMSAAGHHQIAVLTVSRGDFQQGSLGFLTHSRCTLFAQQPDALT